MEGIGIPWVPKVCTVEAHRIGVLSKPCQHRTRRPVPEVPAKCQKLTSKIQVKKMVWGGMWVCERKEK